MKRGSGSVISHKYAEANKKYLIQMKNFLMQLDCRNESRILVALSNKNYIQLVSSGSKIKKWMKFLSCHLTSSIIMLSKLISITQKITCTVIIVIIHMHQNIWWNKKKKIASNFNQINKNNLWDKCLRPFLRRIFRWKNQCNKLFPVPCSGCTFCVQHTMLCWYLRYFLCWGIKPL